MWRTSLSLLAKSFLPENGGLQDMVLETMASVLWLSPIRLGGVFTAFCKGLGGRWGSKQSLAHALRDPMGEAWLHK